MGMHVRGGSQWKQPRVVENSMGPLRRAHPASGATWNVQGSRIMSRSKQHQFIIFNVFPVVRGKMSTACLWHACRALIVGMVLMVIGASMATIGYYSNDFGIGEFRNNSTVRVKNEQRGLHLNNLSYMGPIIMGVGGEYHNAYKHALRLQFMNPVWIFFSELSHCGCTVYIFRSSNTFGSHKALA